MCEKYWTLPASAACRRPSAADGTGYLSLTYRDAAALPWLGTDNLADRTRTFFRENAGKTGTFRISTVPLSTGVIR